MRNYCHDSRRSYVPLIREIHEEVQSSRGGKWWLRRVELIRILHCKFVSRTLMLM